MHSPRLNEQMLKACGAAAQWPAPRPHPEPPPRSLVATIWQPPRPPGLTQPTWTWVPGKSVAGAAHTGMVWGKEEWQSQHSWNLQKHTSDPSITGAGRDLLRRGKNFSAVPNSHEGPNVEELSTSLPAEISSLREIPPGFWEEAGIYVLQPTDGRRTATVL